MKQTLRIGNIDTGAEIELKAVAELTEDMVCTLQTFFGIYQVKGVVTVEVTNKGLWLRNPHTGGRQFLGLARLEAGSATH